MDAGAAVYGYDGEGRRMKKTVGTETTYYFYGVGGLLCEFTTTNTGVTQAASTDRVTYRTSDKLGTAVLVLNASGTVIENNRTLPYGEAWLAEATPSTNDKKFTTYVRDSESGLDYAMNRYYASPSGRFASVDKGDMMSYLPSTLNRYIYSIADPINHTDTDGNIISVPPTPPPPTPFPDPFGPVIFGGEPGPSPGQTPRRPIRVRNPSKSGDKQKTIVSTFEAIRDQIAGMRNDARVDQNCSKTLGKYD